MYLLCFPFFCKQAQSQEDAGDGSAKVALPADAVGEGGNHVTCYSYNGIDQVEEFSSRCQAVDQVGGHQAPDGAAGTDMEAFSADEINQQGCTYQGQEVDQHVLPFRNPVLKQEFVDQQRRHIAAQMDLIHMQKPVQEEPEVLISSLRKANI